RQVLSRGGLAMEIGQLTAYVQILPGNVELALAGQARRPLTQLRQAFQPTCTVMDQVETVGTKLLVLHANAEAVVEILLRVEITPLLTIAADHRTGPVAASVAAAVGA